MYSIQKQINIIIVFILFIQVCAGTQLIDKDNNWKILKQEYFQDNIKYEMQYVDDYTYKLSYKVDQFFYNALKCNDDNCINTLAEIYKDKVKDYDENKRNFLGIGSKYTSKEFKKTYLKKDNVDQDLNQLKINKKFPVDIYNKKGYIIGDINIIDNIEGYVFVRMPDSIYNSSGLKLKIGFGTILIEFNNSKSTETINNYQNNYFKIQSIHRYLSIPKYSNLSISKINYTGLIGNYAIWNITDLFDDASIDSNIWTQTGYTSQNTETDGYLSVKISHDSGTKTTNVTSNGGSSLANIGSGGAFIFNSSMYGSCSGSGRSRANIRLNNGTHSALIDQNTCNAPCSFGGVNNYKLYYVSYNPTTDTVTYRNSTDSSVISTYSLGGNNIYLDFYAEAIATPTPSSCTTEIRTLYFGKNDNVAIYQKWNNSQVYPQNVTITIGGYDVYYEPNEFSSIIELDIKNNLSDSLNGGSCDCTGCTTLNDNCIIPFIFNADQGGKIKYDNLYINYSLAALNITIYDENTNTIIDDRNVTVIFNSVSSSFNLTTDTGNLLAPWSDFNTYNIRYYANGYPTRLRIYKHPGTTDPKLNLYLANYSDSVITKFKVKDQYGNNVQNAQISINKFIIEDNEFRTIADIITNVNGEGSISLVSETELYRFLGYYNSNLYWNKSNPEGSPVYEDDETYLLNFKLGLQDYEITKVLDSITTNTDFVNDNGTGYIEINYSSINNNNICFTTDNISVSPSDRLNLTCLSSTDYNYQYNFNLSSPTTLLSRCIVLINGYYYTVTSIQRHIEPEININPFEISYGYDGLFIAILFLIIGFILFTSNAVLAVISMELAFIILILVGVIDINVAQKFLAILVSLVITIPVISVVGKKNE